MNKLSNGAALFLYLSLIGLPLKALAEQVMSLPEAVQLALQNDPWIHGNSLKQ